jgi:hypothetical protein
MSETAGQQDRQGEQAGYPASRPGAAMPLWLPGEALMVRLVFQPSWGSSGAIDDVCMDPYSR